MERGVFLRELLKPVKRRRVQVNERRSFDRPAIIGCWERFLVVFVLVSFSTIPTKKLNIFISLCVVSDDIDLL